MMSDYARAVVALDAGSVTLSRISTEQLRAELKATLTVTARHLLHLANVWRELERRGEDLSGLRSGLWSYMAMIASEDLRPEIVVRYAGFTALLKRVARLSLADQDKLIADDRVTIVEVTPQGLEERVINLAKLKAPQIAQVLRDRIVTVDEQRRALSGNRVQLSAPGGRKDTDRAVARAKARSARKAGRAARPVRLSLDDGEWAALQQRAEEAGITVAKLVTGSLIATGLISPP